MRCFGRRLGTDGLDWPANSAVWFCGPSVGMSEVLQVVPMIVSTLMMAVRYGDTTTMTAPGRKQAYVEIRCYRGSAELNLKRWAARI